MIDVRLFSVGNVGNILHCISMVLVANVGSSSSAPQRSHM